VRRPGVAGPTEAVWENPAMVFDVVVEVRLRPGIADPQGATIERSLPALGFAGVSGVTVGKSIRFTVDARDEAHARSVVDDMCHRFLTNPVIEDSVVSLSEAAAV
jgi:phosphoribosylformylglycinamidine synthase subunit PurS